MTCTNGPSTASAVPRRPHPSLPSRAVQRRAEGKWRESPADAWLRVPYRRGQRTEPMSDPLQAWRQKGQSEPPTLGAGRLPRLAGRSWPACEGIGEHADATPTAACRPAARTTRSSISRAGRRGGVGVGGGRGGPHGAPQLAVNSLADHSSHSSRIGCVASSSCLPTRAGSWSETTPRRC